MARWTPQISNLSSRQFSLYLSLPSLLLNLAVNTSHQLGKPADLYIAPPLNGSLGVSHVARYSAPSKMATTQEPTFPFESLPKELRLMVYESIPVKTQPWRIVIPNEDDDFPEIEVRSVTVSAQLLATCKFINEEAGPFLQAKVDSIKDTPPIIILDSLKLKDICEVHGFLDTIITQISRMEQAMHFGTQLVPILDGPALERRLQINKSTWASGLSPTDFSVMSSLIYHSAFHLRAKGSQSPCLDIAIWCHGSHTRPPYRAFQSEINAFNLQVHRICSPNYVKVRLRLVLSRRQYYRSHLRASLEDVFFQGVTNSIWGPFIIAPGPSTRVLLDRVASVIEEGV
jgi:hypothetical protein